VDPLAREYDRILSEHGLEPPVRTQPLGGEDLLSRFAPDFDVPFARNPLDHAVDPFPIIHNMVVVVRPGGYVIDVDPSLEWLREDWLAVAALIPAPVGADHTFVRGVGERLCDVGGGNGIVRQYLAPDVQYTYPSASRSPSRSTSGSHTGCSGSWPLRRRGQRRLAPYMA
jgi:hypothetical protein